MLGEIEEIEEIAEEKSWDSVFAAMSAEKGVTRPAQDYDSTVFSGLSPSQRKKMFKVLLEYDDRFAGRGEKLGRCMAAEYSIDTGTAKPIRQVPSAKTWKEIVIVEEHCKDLLEVEVIEPSNSLWGYGRKMNYGDFA